MSTFIVGITGASGAVYAQRLIRKLLEKEHRVLVTITAPGRILLQHELSLTLTAGREQQELAAYFGRQYQKRIAYYDVEDVGMSIASGSYPVDGMVVVPCSMAAVSAIAQGSSLNLLQRAADVCIKERRNLIVVPREMPLSAIHLQNMLTLAQNGACVIPACPSFYSGPQTMEELADTVVSRILDQLHVENDHAKRWTGYPA